MHALTAFAAVISLAATAPDSSSQDTVYRPAIHTQPRQYSAYIGIAGGYTSGYGLSLRRWFNHSWALQMNLFPYYIQTKFGGDGGSTEKDSGYENVGNLSFGLLYLKELTEFRFGRITAYAGGNIHSNYDKYDYWDTHETWNYRDTAWENLTVHSVGRSLSNKVTIGGGAGAEFYVWRFALHLLLGACAGYEINSKAYSVLPTVEGGIQFRL